MAESSLLFDRALLRRRRARAAVLGPATFLMDHVAIELAERLSAVTRRFRLGADIGSPTTAVQRAALSSGKVDTLIGVAAHDPVGRNGAPMIRADEEALPFKDAVLDLVTSALCLQFVNDLPGTLLQIRRALKPDGLLLAALLGERSLTELRQAFALAETEIEGGLSPRVAPFADVRTLGALLQRAGFALPVVDLQTLTVRYDSAFALMQDLRRMGATNVLTERRRTVLKRATLRRVGEIYATQFADHDRRVRATFDVVWLAGWAPHPSQQQPLRPGSAQARLADALGATEISAGEGAQAVSCPVTRAR
jgi:SAM-dependent methyltransferase